MKYDWSSIKIDYETGNYSYKDLEKKYGAHRNTIGNKSKKEKWIKGDIPKKIKKKATKLVALKLSKSVIEINRETDKILELAKEKAKGIIKGNDVTALDLNMAVSSVQGIRKEQMDIRGELTPIQKARLTLDKQKFTHKKDMDKENLKVKKVVSKYYKLKDKGDIYLED